MCDRRISVNIKYQGILRYAQDDIGLKYERQQ